MSSIFTKIINKEIPCFKIAENDQFIAFLDINPLVKGHCLVVPKVELDYIFDLNDDTLKEMMTFSKVVASKLKSAISCNRIGVSVIGLEVPHAHIHLIPINHMDDMNFSNPKLKLSSDEMNEVQQKILLQN